MMADVRVGKCILERERQGLRAVCWARFLQRDLSLNLEARCEGSRFGEVGVDGQV